MVEYLSLSYRVSERRACRVTRLHRGTYPYSSHKNPWTALRMKIREIAQARVRYALRLSRTPRLTDETDYFRLADDSEITPPTHFKCECYRKFLRLSATHVFALGTRRRGLSEKFSTKVSGPGGATPTGSALDVHLDNFAVAF